MWLQIIRTRQSAHILIRLLGHRIPGKVGPHLYILLPAQHLTSGLPFDNLFCKMYWLNWFGWNIWCSHFSARNPVSIVICINKLYLSHDLMTYIFVPKKTRLYNAWAETILCLDLLYNGDLYYDRNIRTNKLNKDTPLPVLVQYFVSYMCCFYSKLNWGICVCVCLYWSHFWLVHGIRSRQWIDSKTM